MLYTCLFGGVALAATAILYILCPVLSLWWALPFVIGFYVAISVVYVLGLFVVSLFPIGNDRYQSTACHFIICHTLPWIMPLIGGWATLEGIDQLPHRPFLLVGNHRSNFDPLLTFMAFRKYRIAYVSKPENFRIPLAGSWMKRAAFLAIDRENPRKAMTAIHQAADLITDHGLCVGLYPEGTRNKAKDLLPLLPFHNGSLKIAKLAKCPVVTVSLRYERKVLWRVARLKVVDVMDEEFVTANRTDTIGERVKEAIEKELEKY